MDYITEMEELKKYIKDYGMEQGDLEMQEDWICSMCKESLSNNDIMLEYKTGWGSSGYICEKCWGKAFEDKEK